jgi:glutamyl/glutaminyl-tRNA synthetase
MRQGCQVAINLAMTLDGQIAGQPPRENPYTAEDVLAILREQAWLLHEPSAQQKLFCERAAAFLGHFSNDRAELVGLLRLIFSYNASRILESTEAHSVLSRYAARDVIRLLALFLLDPVPFTSERFKEAVTQLKEKLDLRGRDLFHPIRLALAGRVGEGELDRVILLADEGSSLEFAVPVKAVRARMLEFCSVLD